MYAGIQRPKSSINVFILYCKDQQLPQTFSDDILDLADILNYCGGFTCTVDHYVDAPPPNWNIWTQQLIEKSQYVILVCSPTLFEALREPGSCELEMEKGKCYANSVVNYVQPQKFIPVLLNNHAPQGNRLDWVPAQLHMSSLYRLNISELRSALTVPKGTPRHVFDERLRQALTEERFRSIMNLLNHLRGETATSRPRSPENPISVDALSEEFPPDPMIRQIAARLKEKWFTLGIKLGVSSFALDSVKESLSNPTDYESATKEVFVLWRAKKKLGATKEALKQVLDDMEYRRLTEKLF